MRRLAALALVAVSLLLASACSGKEAAAPNGDKATAQLVSNAAAHTSAARTSKAAFTIRMTGLAAGPIDMSGEGIFDSAKQRGRMSFDLSQLGKASGGQDLGRLEMVFDKLVVYMRWPFLQRMSPSVKEWVKFDLEQLGKQQGFDLGQLSQLQQSDPSQALAYLRAAGGKVTTIGEADVRGVATTHYGLTVDLEKVAASAPPDQRAEVKASIDSIIRRTGIRRVPTEVWIDDDGLVRRERLHYQDVQFVPGQRGDMTMTMDLFDFGVHVGVQPPPPDEVTDLGELMAQS